MNCVMPRTRAGQPVLKVQLPTEVDLVIPAHQSFTAGYASEFQAVRSDGLRSQCIYYFRD